MENEVLTGCHRSPSKTLTLFNCQHFSLQTEGCKITIPRGRGPQGRARGAATSGFGDHRRAEPVPELKSPRTTLT